MSKQQPHRSDVPINQRQAVPPNQTADQAYYAARGMSVINNANAVTRRGRPGDPLQTRRQPAYDPSDQDADRYYREGGSRHGQRGQKTGYIVVPDQPQRVTRGGAVVPAAGRRDPGATFKVRGELIATPVLVRSRADVAQAVETAITAIARGEPRVFVQAADADCARRVSAAVELSVARGLIAGERVGDISIGVRAGSAAELAKQMFGEVQAPPAVEQVESGQTGSGAEIDDFATFVKGGPGPREDQADPAGLAGLAGSVGVSTGHSPDPVVAAARNERGKPGERPDGPAREHAGRRKRGKRQAVEQAVEAELRPVVDPVVAAARAEPADDGSDVDE